jgi:TrwC relaxase
VAYLTAGQHAGGCAGAMSYYTAAGEPPGQWAGRGAATLGLRGQVDPAVIGRLYQHNIGLGGELLVKRRQSKAVGEREQAAVTAYLAAHPYASAAELAEVRAVARGTDPHQVPYFDLTVDVVKSVSVLHASYRIGAMQARRAGRIARADVLDARADAIEGALMDAARDAVAWLEQQGSERDGDGARIPLSAGVFTRTGYHSSTTGE